jgi:hypothetical protein
MSEHQTKVNEEIIESKEEVFEDAFDKILLATWNRQRSVQELRDFVLRHHEPLLDVEL